MSLVEENPIKIRKPRKPRQSSAKLGIKAAARIQTRRLAKDVVNAKQVAANKNIFFDEKNKPRTVSQVYGILQKKIGEE